MTSYLIPATVQKYKVREPSPLGLFMESARNHIRSSSYNSNNVQYFCPIGRLESSDLYASSTAKTLLQSRCLKRRRSFVDQNTVFNNTSLSQNKSVPWEDVETSTTPLHLQCVPARTANKMVSEPSILLE